MRRRVCNGIAFSSIEIFEGNTGLVLSKTIYAEYLEEDNNNLIEKLKRTPSNEQEVQPGKDRQSD
jgi:hypothetical protein